MAGEPYAGPARPAPDIVAKINYEAWGKIKFDMDHALYADGPGRFPVSFFHLGMFFQKAVEMHVVDAGQRAANHLRSELFRNARGFDRAEACRKARVSRVCGSRKPRDGTLDWHKNDWVAFLGADYFRAIGELRQYGLSARAVALDVAAAGQSRKNFRISRNSISVRAKQAIP